MSVDTRIEGEAGPAEDAARWLRLEWAAALADLADRFVRMRRLGQDGWRSEAGELFVAAMGRAVAATDVLESGALATARALEDYAGALRHCQAQMREVRADAAQAGLIVSGFLIHDPAPIPGAGVADLVDVGGMADMAQRRRLAYADAAARGEWIRSVYQDACQELRARYEQDDPARRDARADLAALAAPRPSAVAGAPPAGGTAGLDPGNTDGVPLAQRGEANWAALQAAISEARADGDDARLARLLGIRDAIADPATGQPIATLIQFEPDSSRYAVLWGDPSAAHVGLYVPGVGNPEEIPRSIRWARDLWNAGRRNAAVIMWNGYDNPNAPWDPDVLNSVVDARARAGAQSLTRFVDDGLLLGPGQDLTLIGHSYGSLVIGHGMADMGLEADRVVVVGSPGMDVEDVADLHISGDRFYAERAPGDMIGNSAAHGPDPAGPGFGGRRLATNAPDAPRVTGHSDYFDPNSEALNNIAAVVTDTVDAGDIQQPTPGDHAGDMVTNLIQDLEDATPAGWLADHYDGPGSDLFQEGDHILNGVAGYAGTGTRNLVDTIAGQVDVADILDLPR